MRKTFKIGLLIAVVLLLIGSIGAYVLTIPHYKSIELNGYSFEVPESNNTVQSINDNYKKYDDNEKNITIKSYAINNVNETNFTGAGDVGYQVGSNFGQNITSDNITLMNQSGKYSYYEITPYQMIVITCNDLDTIKHMIKTMNKTSINLTDVDVDLTTFNATNDTSNDTVNQTASTTSTQKTSTKKSTSSSSNKKSYSSSQSSSSSSSSGDEYFVVNKKTGKKEYGPAHPNYGTPNDYLYEQHRSWVNI